MSMPEHWFDSHGDYPSGPVCDYAEAYARKHAEKVEAELAALRAAVRLRRSARLPMEIYNSEQTITALLTEEP